MKARALLIVILLFSMAASAQMIHPLSDPDIVFGNVSQIKEIFYLEPKKGESIDTLEKRIFWYNKDGNTDDIVRARRSGNRWVSNPDEFAIRLNKFGDPPVTTGRDKQDFKIQFDYLGNEIERDNYQANGTMYSKIVIHYEPNGIRKKSETYINGELSYTTNYFYEQNRLIKEHITFANKSTFDINYKYEGVDAHNNWIKRTRILSNALKDDRPQVTERRVIYYP